MDENTIKHEATVLQWVEEALLHARDGELGAAFVIRSESSLGIDLTAADFDTDVKTSVDRFLSRLDRDRLTAMLGWFEITRHSQPDARRVAYLLMYARAMGPVGFRPADGRLEDSSVTHLFEIQPDEPDLLLAGLTRQTQCVLFALGLVGTSEAGIVQDAAGALATLVAKARGL